LDTPAPPIDEEELEVKKMAAENAARRRVNEKRRRSQAKQLKQNIDW
jgi:hypothetical protein